MAILSLGIAFPWLRRTGSSSLRRLQRRKRCLAHSPLIRTTTKTHYARLARISRRTGVLLCAPCLGGAQAAKIHQVSARGEKFLRTLTVPDGVYVGERVIFAFKNLIFLSKIIALQFLLVS